MQQPRGTRDLFGEELERIRYVQRTVSRTFKRYGYREVETPIFENLELFTKKSGTNVMDQIYNFKDKSGRELALRPELTTPVVRLYNTQLKSDPKPLKLYYFGMCFRYERPQIERGRYRQFLQAGCELIGTEKPEADAEVAAITSDIAKNLGLKNCELKIGNIRLLREVLKSAGIQIEDQDPIMRAIDSKEKARLEDELKKLERKDAELVEKLVSLRGGPEVLDKASELVEKLPDAKLAIKNMKAIMEKMNQLGVTEFSLDLGIARGLDYYTDFVFELYSDGIQLGGGGRYNDLIEALGGKSCPAVGVGLGIDRLSQAVERQKVEVPVDKLDCVVLPAKPETLGDALEVARELRNAGLNVEVDLMGRNLSKGFSYADTRGAKYALVIGPEELKANEVTIKDMASRSQRKVKREKLAGELA